MHFQHAITYGLFFDLTHMGVFCFFIFPHITIFYEREPYDQNPVLLSSLNIVKGQPMPMDLARVETKSQVYNFTMSFIF